MRLTTNYLVLVEREIFLGTPLRKVIDAMNETDAPGSGSLEEQLHAFYEERKYLEGELGISDARELVTMVQSLEAQLIDLYQQQEEEVAK